MLSEKIEVVDEAFRCNCCYLMLDFDPDAAGKKGQIICYIHDPDRIFYVTSSISDLISKVIRDLYSID